MAAVRAVRSMIAAGRGRGVMAVARDFVKRTKVLAIASFDDSLTEAGAGMGDTGEPERKSVATALVDLAQEHYTFGMQPTSGSRSACPRTGPRSWPCCAAARHRCGPSWRASTTPGPAALPPSRR